MKYLIYTLLLPGLLVNGSCNKNSNELPPVSAPEATLIIPKTVHNTLLVEATVYKHTTPTTDSFSVSFKNRTSATLSKLRVAVEICKSLPQQYGSCQIYLDTLITLPQGANSAKFLLGKNLKLPLTTEHFNVYVISYEMSVPNVFSGVYHNRFSLFRKDSTLTTAYPQLYGFVTADGEALFRMKVSDSIYYTIDEGRFQGTNYFTGKLFSGDEIKAYLTLDTNENKIVLSPDNTQLRFLLSSPLEDSTDNIHLNAFRKP